MQERYNFLLSRQYRKQQNLTVYVVPEFRQQCFEVIQEPSVQLPPFSKIFDGLATSGPWIMLRLVMCIVCVSIVCVFSLVSQFVFIMSESISRNSKISFQNRTAATIKRLRALT